MSKFVLRSLVLLIGLSVFLSAADPWSYAGLLLVVGAFLDVLGTGRQPVKKWATIDRQKITVVQCGPQHVEVIKVLREYLEPDPGASALKSRLGALPSEVGQVPSTAAAEELCGRLESLQTRADFRPAT